MLDQDLERTSKNHLLACLSGADRDLLAPCLKSVQLKLRQRLEIPDQRIRAVYFVERGLVSVVAIGSGDRRQTEVGIIGREGMTGLALVLGSDRCAHDTFVQSEGTAHCITAADLQVATESSRSLHATLLRYAYVCSVSLAQTALANAQATIEERLARWLHLPASRRCRASSARCLAGESDLRHHSASSPRSTEPPHRTHRWVDLYVSAAGLGRRPAPVQRGG